MVIVAIREDVMPTESVAIEGHSNDEQFGDHYYTKHDKFLAACREWKFLQGLIPSQCISTLSNKVAPITTIVGLVS
jgi:hypothetical protein